jgi:hypothetical protein
LLRPPLRRQIETVLGPKGSTVFFGWTQPDLGCGYELVPVRTPVETKTLPEAHGDLQSQRFFAFRKIELSPPNPKRL